jgi:hypothetical protein
VRSFAPSQQKRPYPAPQADDDDDDDDDEKMIVRLIRPQKATWRLERRDKGKVDST